MHTEFKTIADRVKQVRTEKNYSQDYLAKKLGFTQKAYSKIENNETKLNVETLLKISEILETPINAFFDESSKPVLNDFSNRSGGDNVIYKNHSIDKIEELYNQLIASKEEIIKAKDSVIESMKAILDKRM